MRSAREYMALWDEEVLIESAQLSPGERAELTAALLRRCAF